MVEDIRQNGILLPITLYHGKIVDGRNRYRAAKQCKHKFTEQDFRALTPGLDPKAFVISANIARRQLTTKQKRGFIAKQIEALPEETDRTIAKLCCCDSKTVASVRDQMYKRVETPVRSWKELNSLQRREFAQATRGDE